MPVVVAPRPGLEPTGWLEPTLAALNRGGIVLFPTETVYGIGVRADNPAALGRLRGLKGKPAKTPLLLHCADFARLTGWVEPLPDSARRLAERYWPGPLALVLGRGRLASAALTGGRGTVGVRVVAEPTGRALLAALDCPLAGTSANLHGRPPVADFRRLDPDLLAGVDVAIDAGNCGPGIASTILDLSEEEPALIRAGAVPVSELESLLGWRLGTPGR